MLLPDRQHVDAWRLCVPDLNGEATWHYTDLRMVLVIAYVQA